MSVSVEGSEITEYAGFAVEYRDSSHRYWLRTGGERTPAVSVTTALRVLDKPALVSWAERCGVEAALELERNGQLAGISPWDAVGAIRSMGYGAGAKRDAGADRGTAVHEALRLYCSEGTVPNVGDFPAEVRGYVSACCKWLLKTRPEPVLVEQVIGSPTHGYAGRLDLIADIDGRRLLVDFKTSPAGRVYDEAHLQTAAYMRALPECGLPEVDGAVIVAFGEDGEYEQAGCEADPADFLVVLQTYRVLTRLRSARKATERKAAA